MHTRGCCTLSDKVTASIPYECSRYCYRSVTQISRHPVPVDSRVDDRSDAARKKKAKRKCATKHHVRPHIESENCTTTRETRNSNQFFLPLSPHHSSRPPVSTIFPHPAPKYILLASRGFKTKMYVPIGWPLFVRDCETRFLRKRREKLQSRFVERFD